MDQTVDVSEKWSVRNMLIFSNLPGIREAIDGQTNLRLFTGMEMSDSEEEFDPP